MSFFNSGTVDTNQFNRDKLPCLESGDPNKAERAVYRVKLTDFADYYGAPKGNRTQIDVVVLNGLVASGTKGGHIVMHKHDEAWQANKARGEIAAGLGAFLGMNRSTSGLKITDEVFQKQTRIVNQNVDNGKTVSVSRDASELPLVQEGAEAFLVVEPYFDKKTKVRKFNPKTKQPSVTYEFYPLSANLQVTEGDGLVSGTFLIEDAPAAPSDEPAVDALEAALADGWKPNGTTGWFYKKGESSQLKEPALRAKYAAA